MGSFKAFLSFQEKLTSQEKQKSGRSNMKGCVDIWVLPHAGDEVSFPLIDW